MVVLQNVPAPLEQRFQKTRHMSWIWTVLPTEITTLSWNPEQTNSGGGIEIEPLLKFLNLLAQTKSRIIDIEPYKTSSGTRYMVVTVDNANPLERRVRNFYSSRAQGAERGFYLKRVGGEVLAKVRERTQFVPASSLKAPLPLCGLQRIDNRNINLTTSNRTLCGQTM